MKKLDFPANNSECQATSGQMQDCPAPRIIGLHMSVTRDEVFYAYRLILGREPENEEVIGQAMEAKSLAHLREVFLGSQEFSQKYDEQAGGALHVGRFNDITSDDIDISTTPEQLQAMFDRIGRAWRQFGETEPHWSVLTNDAFRQGSLSDNIDSFYDSGYGDIETHLNFLRRAKLPTSFAKALDFGCGVGRLTLALAHHAKTVVGIDISPPHLELAAERARLENVANASFENIASVNDLDRYKDFDFVFSRIVLQHNPPPVMAALFDKLLAALAPNGTAIVQMPTYMHGRRFSTSEYLASEQPAMEMNGLPQPIIFQIIDQAGCKVIEVREDDSAGNAALSHVFCVQKRAT